MQQQGKLLFPKPEVIYFLTLPEQKKPISKQPGVWYPQGIPDIRHGRERSTKQDEKGERFEQTLHILRKVT